MQLLKRLRRQRVRRKCRQQETAERKVLIVKPSTTALVLEQRQRMRELWLPSQATKVRDQCSREVLGYLTQAHFSFIKGKSAGVGYITPNGLRCLRRLFAKANGSLFVLVRSPSSVHYRKCTLRIRVH